MKKNKETQKILKMLFIGTQMETGGAQKVLLEQANWFNKKGHSVVCCFLYDKEKLHNQWQEVYDFPIIDLGINKMNPFSILLGCVRLFKLMRRYHFDAVETFTIHSNVIGISLAFLSGIPVRVPSHHGFVDNAPRWLQLLHGRICNSRMTSRLVAVSEKAASVAVQNEKVHQGKITIIQNGINNPPVIDPQKLEALTEELKLYPFNNLILAVGRLVPAKNFEELIYVAASIKEFSQKTHFFILGDGFEKEELLALTQQKGVSDIVHFMGIRNDVNEWLQLANAFIMTSRWEGLSIALLEAMGAGVPIIVSDTSVPQGLITDKVEGLCIRPKDIDGYVRAIIEICQDQQLAESLSTNARAKAVNEFSLNSMSSKYYELFLELLQR